MLLSVALSFTSSHHSSEHLILQNFTADALSQGGIHVSSWDQTRIISLAEWLCKPLPYETTVKWTKYKVFKMKSSSTICSSNTNLSITDGANTFSFDHLCTIWQWHSFVCSKVFPCYLQLLRKDYVKFLHHTSLFNST